MSSIIDEETRAWNAGWGAGRRAAEAKETGIIRDANPYRDDLLLKKWDAGRRAALELARLRRQR